MEVGVVQRLAPLDADLSASAEIGRDGGEISIPEAGIRVVFPRNAVLPSAGGETIRVTVTALQGSNTRLHFRAARRA